MKRMSLLKGMVGVLAFFGFFKLTLDYRPGVQETMRSVLSREDVDDIAGRSRQEWMQLRDPY